MFQTRRSRLTAIATVLLLASGAPEAHAQTPAARKQATLLGTRPWVVWKLDLRDFDEKNDKVIADFNTEAEASEYAQQLSAAEKEWARWAYLSGKRQNDGGESKDTGDEPVIRKVETKFVDVPPLKRTSILSGKKGKQKVGKTASDIEFRADGKFAIDGNVNENHSWVERQGSVLVTTDSYRFSGTLKNGEILGKRYLRADYSQADDWNVDVGLQSAKTIVGTKWTGKYFVGNGYWYFNKNGVVEGKFPRGDVYVGHWAQSGTKITISRKAPDKPDELVFEGEFVGDILKGRKDDEVYRLTN